jgi:hypothetical protein
MSVDRTAKNLGTMIAQFFSIQLFVGNRAEKKKQLHMHYDLIKLSGT